MNDSTEGNVSPAWLGFSWKWVLGMLIPAVFAGVFAYIPHLIDRITSPKAVLEYTVVSSPLLKTEQGYVQIFAVALHNAGTKTLTNVRADANVSGGAFEQAVLAGGAGDAPAVSYNGEVAVIAAKTLLPTERITSTFQVRTDAATSRPDIRVRSAEVLGRPAVLGSAKGSLETPSRLVALLAASGAAISTATMALVVRSRMRGRHVVDRYDVIQFAGVLAGTREAREVLVQSLPEMTYALASDFLLAEVFRVPPEHRAAQFHALIALALSPPVAEPSRAIIYRNLEKAGMTLTETARAELATMRGRMRTPADYRLEVHAYLATFREPSRGPALDGAPEV